ncbi:hypothetical protein CUM50_05385 [Enterococcus faecium]|nr:hypothetical protein [Enterococcus faecium]PQD74474.1 hypothetical protein CUM50_05385 [Enterococcus faecium]
MNTVYKEVVSLPFNSESQEIISKITSPVFGLVGLLSRSSCWESIYQKKECDIGHTPFLFSLKHLSVLDSIQDKRL